MENGLPLLDTLLAFAALAFVMAISPGLNLMVLVSRLLCQGATAGFVSLAGVVSAMLVYGELALKTGWPARSVNG